METYKSTRSDTSKSVREGPEEIAQHDSSGLTNEAKPDRVDNKGKGKLKDEDHERVGRRCGNPPNNSRAVATTPTNPQWRDAPPNEPISGDNSAHLAYVVDVQGQSGKDVRQVPEYVRSTILGPGRVLGEYGTILAEGADETDDTESIKRVLAALPQLIATVLATAPDPARLHAQTANVAQVPSDLMASLLCPPSNIALPILDQPNEPVQPPANHTDIHISKPSADPASNTIKIQSVADFIDRYILTLDVINEKLDETLFRIMEKARKSWLTTGNKFLAKTCRYHQGQNSADGGRLRLLWGRRERDEWDHGSPKVQKRRDM